MTLARKIIAAEEGWRDRPYYCSEGYPTVGYGFRLAGKGDPLPNFVLPRAAGDAWLDALILSIEHTMSAKLERLNVARSAVVVSMCYQLGIQGVLQFKRMWAAIDRQDWVSAADEMLDSRWAKQTPERAQRHAQIMRTGTTT